MPTPTPGAGGRPRKKCDICSPPRVRPPKPKGEPAGPVSLRDQRAAEPAAPVDETLSLAVKAELGDRSGTVDGVLAMRIARLIDNSEPTAAALATLSKQLRAHITAATAGRPAAPDGISAQQDELQARRGA